MKNRMKMASAGAGAAAVVAMGVLGAAFPTDDDATVNIGQPEITTGETTTSSTAPSEPETSVAVPEVTAEPAPTA